MNEQLLKFIELCLTDGVITDKEREVIFRKAKELNIDIDECEIILDSMIQQKNIVTNVNINEEIPNLISEKQSKDILYTDALKLVVEYQDVSEEFLKKYLNIDTNRAFLLIEQFEKDGVINKSENKFNINITNDEFLNNFLNNGEIKKFEIFCLVNILEIERNNNAKIPKFSVDSYTYKLDIGPEIIDMTITDVETLDYFFEVKIKNGFKGIEEFFGAIEPKDEFIIYLKILFEFGTIYKKIKKYTNGDYFLGQIYNNKANGFGEMNIVCDSLFSNKRSKYIGYFVNDIFLEGNIIYFISDEPKNVNLVTKKNYFEYGEVRNVNNNYFAKSITYPNEDTFYGDVINFERNGKGEMTTSNDFIIGDWKNDIIIEYSSLKECREKINSLRFEDKYKECVEEAKLGESIFEYLFKDSDTALNYLWSLKEIDIEKAFDEIDRITKIVKDKDKLQNVFGIIYQKKGEKTNNIDLLNKALEFFKSHNYKDKKIGEGRISNIQEKINKIILNENILKKSDEFINKNTINNAEIKPIIQREYVFKSKKKLSMYEPHKQFIDIIKITPNSISCSRYFGTADYSIDLFNPKLEFNSFESETSILLKNYTKMEINTDKYRGDVDLTIIGKNSKNTIKAKYISNEDVSEIKKIIAKYLN